MACMATAAHAQFAQFTIDAEHGAGQLNGSGFAEQNVRFTFLMDTQTGTATFGGGGGSTIYDEVATSAWLDVGGEHLVRHGLGRIFLTEDEGFDYLVADIFGLHATFWRNYNDGPFTDPSFELPLSTGRCSSTRASATCCRTTSRACSTRRTAKPAWRAVTSAAWR